MKKAFLFAIALLVMCSAMGQKWEIKVEQESQALKFSKTNVLQRTNYIGSTNRDIVLLRYTNDKSEAPYLVRYNKSLEEQQSEMLPFSRKEMYYGGYVNDDEIDLIQTYVDGDKIVVTHLIFDAATLKQKESEPMGEYAYDDNSQLIVKESQSQNMIAIISITSTPKVGNCMVKCYNTLIEEQWSSDYYTDLLDDIVVTDNGEVAFLGYRSHKGSGKTHLKFTLLGNGKENIYETDKEIGDVFRIRLIGYSDGMFYCTGMIKDKEWKDEKNKDFASGFFTLAYDSKKESVTAYDTHLLTKEEYCAVYNFPTNRVHNNPIHINAMFLVASCVDEDGAVFLLQNTCDLYYYDSFDRTNYCGFYMVKMDRDGKLKWSKMIRHSSAAIGKNFRKASKFKLFKTGDSYSVVYLEIEKNIPRSATKFYDLVALGRGKCDLQMLTIDSNGRINRQFYKLPKKSIMIGAPHRLEDGRLLLLMSQPDASNAIFLEYK